MYDLYQELVQLSPDERRVLEQLLRDEGIDLRQSYILPRPDEDADAPLSWFQERLWFLDRLTPDQPLDLIVAPFRLRGPLALPALEAAVHRIQQRHALLRSTVARDVPRQQSHPRLPVRPALIDLTALPVSLREAQIPRLLARAARRALDLSQGPPLRLTLLRLAPQDHVVVFTLHHLVSDQWSIGLFLQELTTAYAAARAGTPPALPALPIQYADYAFWQRAPTAADTWAAQRDYWVDHLRDVPWLLDLPTDYPRPAHPHQPAALRRFQLPQALTPALQQLGRQHGATLFMVLLAAYALLLQRYTAQSALVLGTPIANRQRAETRSLIGPFLNTLALAIDLTGNPTVRTLLARVREVCIGGYAQQDLPFEQVVEALRVPRDLRRSPLFQVMFSLQNAPMPEQAVAEVRWHALVGHSATTRYDLTLLLMNGPAGLVGALEYRADLFAPTTIDRMAAHYERLLTAFVATPDQPIAALPLLTLEEQQRLLVEWNATATAYPQDQYVHDLIVQQAARTPEAIAVRYGDQQLTYRELLDQAQQLTQVLQAQGIGPDICVGVCLERSLELSVALLAILLAGGAYMPLDPSYPKERLQFMLRDSQAPVLISHSALLACLPDHSAQLVLLDTDGPALAERFKTHPPTRRTPDQLAYVIYTSGSTGQPKGAMNTHRGIVNRLLWMQETYQLTADDRVLHKTSISFDVSVWELLWPLIAGGTLVMALPDGHKDPAYLVDLIASERITTMHFVPPMLQAFLAQPDLDRCQSLRRVICSGEALPSQVQQLFFARLQAELHNLYGPTEAAIDVTAWACQPQPDQQPVPIGRPVANTQMYVLDAHFQLVPVGVPGELYIGGIQLARGYVRRPDLTAEKFLPDPFSGQPGARLYRTGDRARYVADGALEFLGRQDQQIKLRGFRIELDEIAAVLRQHPTVHDAVALLRTDAGDPQLVAYVVADPAQDAAPLDTDALRAVLQTRLPAYMLPAALVPLPALPLTPNGKLDRRALPAPTWTPAAVAPRTPTEALLAQLWSSLLGLPAIGRTDNFFALGGHSLLATRLVARLQPLVGAELPVRLVFEHPTVAELATSIDAIRWGSTPPLPIQPVPRDGRPLPLSFAQQRLWFLDRLQPGNPSYNMHTGVRLTGRLDIEAVERSLNAIIARHEGLRTTFKLQDEDVVQVIAPAWSLRLPVVDLRALPVADREVEAERLAAEESNWRFDLQQGPLLRARLLWLDEEQYIILLVMHHIISDGWSLGILVQELAAFYAAYTSNQDATQVSLLPLPIQYADFAVWQRQWLAPTPGGVLESQLSYWKRQLADLQVLELPTDRPRPTLPSFRGATEAFALPPDLSAELLELSRREGVTLFMTLLAAWQALLARYSGQDDIVVGSPIANRTRVELEPLIGFFVNMLVLRTDFANAPATPELLARVREVCLGAYAHQDLPFEQLVEELQPDRNLSHTPLFQVVFALQNTPVEVLEVTDLTLSPIKEAGDTVNFDLSLLMQEGANGISGWLEYNTDLFDTTTIMRLIGHFQALLAHMVAYPDQSVAQLSILDETELQHLLVTWNDTATQFRQAPYVHQMFERQALRTPDALALRCADQELSYALLNRRANQVAHYLRSIGVGAGVPVALCAERSLDFVVGLLGIFKTGGVYVPLDPEYPVERLAFMLQDSQASVILTQQRHVTELPDHTATTICLDANWETIAAWPEHNPEVAIAPNALAYLIYTSGSTGNPKGVMVEHAQLTNTLLASQTAFAFTSSDRMPCIASFSFDISLFELFCPLLAGGTSIILTRQAILDLPGFTSLLEDATVLHTLPGLMRQVVDFIQEQDRGDRYRELRHIFVGGDAVAPDLLSALCTVFPQAQINVLYGPTEAAIICAAHVVAPDRILNHQVIGKPLSNTFLRVYDQHRQLAPIGVAGELYIGGASVSRGYLGQAALTNDKYVWIDEQRWYRTGDRVRYVADGTLIFLGRQDQQIKLRGFRIELDEIAAVLRQHPTVHDAVALLRIDSGDPQLVAYVVADPAQDAAAPLDTDALRAVLQTRLPAYMLPAALVPLPALPLTPNGKLDRRALPAPTWTPAAVAPRTPTEALLAQLWSSLLGLPAIGRTDNFFALGGHSLLATRLVARLQPLVGAELPVRLVFEHPTVAELATSIDAQQHLAQPSSGAIAPVEPRPARIPLSFAQQRLWFLDRLQPGNPFYNISIAVELAGPLDQAALRTSIQLLIARHESLRTTFVVEDDQPVQRIASELVLPLPVRQLAGSCADEQARMIVVHAGRAANHPFDLARGPLLYGELLHLDDTRHVLLLTLHHIIADGWSIGVIIREVAELYQAQVNKTPVTLPPLPIQYADYAIWQHEWLAPRVASQDTSAATSSVWEDQMTYWRSQLQDAPQLLTLPTDRRRPPVQRFQGAQHSIHLGADLHGGLLHLCQDSGSTLFMVLLAAWQVLLARWSEQDDIVVGTPIANRTRVETEALIGFFANTLALRTTLHGQPSFREVLARVRETTLGAYTHQDLPFEQIVEALSPTRDLSYNPLFQVIFILQNAPLPRIALHDVQLTMLESPVTSAKFDLELSLEETGQGISGSLTYNTDLFESATIERMADQLQVLLTAVVTNPDTAIAKLPLLSTAERQQILYEWNATEAAYPYDQCIHQLVEAQVDRTGAPVAVVYGEQSITYAQLNQRANQLAHYLQALDVGPETRVGLCMEPALELVVGLLGILKAGGAYVPLDPDYPQQRLDWLVHDSAVQVIVTLERDSAAVSDCGAQLVCLDRDWSRIANQRSDTPKTTVTPDCLAYIIYTSGSTGQPKGTLITHRGVVNNLWWRQSTWKLTTADRMLQTYALSFDPSVWSIFWPLIAGAQVVLVPSEERGDSRALARLIERHAITAYGASPTLHSVLLEEPELAACRSLRYIVSGGESLSDELQRRFFEILDATICNAYGPTEATIDTTFWVCPRVAEPIPALIGRPLPNVQVYLLDVDGAPVPVGVPGELYIGGAGLARGYVRRPDLTAEKFLPDPFSGQPGARLYRTGDRVRYVADGALEFLGRQDQQIKLRGFRIELDEIAAVLRQHPTVHDAVALLRIDAGEPQLVAYVVADPAQDAAAPLDTDVLRAVLQTRLPAYMLPAALVPLPALPLTPNGKLDRRALPAPTWTPAAVAPHTPTEALLAQLWSSLLGLPAIGRTDNFFALGGHSLLATRLVAHLRAHLHLEIPLHAFFAGPTVAELAARIDELRWGSTPPPPIQAVPRDGQPLPLSFAQRRLWLLDQVQPGMATYNLPTVLRLSGALDTGALERSLSLLVERHEILRTTFELRSGEPVQVIQAAASIHLPVTEVQGSTPAEREAIARQLATREAHTSFDLQLGPLLRLRLLRLQPDDHVLILVLHHIIADGWSIGILLRELTTLYRAFSAGLPSPLAELPLQYADYALWQQQWLQGDMLAEQRAYWIERLAELPLLDLPTDHPRPALPSGQGSQYPVNLTPEITAGLVELSRHEGVTLFMVLLAAFQTLLYRYSAQQDFAIGTPIASRTHVETEGLLGMFVNTLVLRADLSGQPTFRELLARVREQSLQAYAHQEIPFEQVVEAVQPARVASHHPLFQVMFALQPAQPPVDNLPGLTLAPLNITGETAKFDLSLALEQTSTGLRGAVEYSCDLFEAATIERMIGHWQQLLVAIVADPAQQITRLPLLTEAEALQLAAWNATTTPYPDHSCLHELIEHQAARSPAALALQYRDQSLTYAELVEQARQIARALQARGVGPDTSVGVCMERSPRLVAALLGILQAGGCYVPLDPTYPQERLRFILTDAQVAVLITEQDLLPRLPVHHVTTLCLDEDDAEIVEQPRTSLTSRAQPMNLAYILYTSGSTGQPKGVQITHRGLVNFLHAAVVRPGLQATDTLPAITTIAFDIAGFELWGPLLVGACIMLVERDVTVDGVQLAKMIDTSGARVLQATPATWRLLLAADWTGSPQLTAMSLGEELPSDLAEALLARVGRLWNLYGPTETTVWSTASEILPDARKISLGTPIANTQLYVLDATGAPVPVGVPGELYIGGAGLARGYVRRPNLTAEKFLPDPFSGQPGARLYRTGDRVRYVADGALEFLGRQDRQIKLRGFRIELDEIAAVLRQHPAVHDASVLLRAHRTDDPQLVAYVAAVATPDSHAQRAAIMAHLRAYLPAYAVPSAIVLLPALPLSPNGKVDRRALPAPQRPETQTVFDLPRDQIELQLMQMWQTLLNLPRVGIHDNFFDLGGHSLLAVRLMSQIRRQFGQQLPLTSLFRGATIEHLAAALREQAPPTPALAVAMQPHGTRRPFFCVHPAGGNVFSYLELARELGPDQRIYGLQAAGLVGEQEPDQRIEAMAARYIDALREIQPHGPYQIGGWSLGGVIAFEMARQLQANGEQISLVALIDSSFAVDKGIDARDLVAGFAYDLGLPAEGVAGASDLRHVFEQAQTRNIIPPDVDFSYIDRLFTVYSANMRALQSYVPQIYHGQVTLFQARDQAREMEPRVSMAWDTVATEGMRATLLPGDHYTLLRKPHVAHLAAHLNTYLDQDSWSPHISSGSAADVQGQVGRGADE